MLQENAITGLFFIIGIGLNSPIMLLGACIATLSGIILAKRLKYDVDEIEKGLYGYNAALVGCAIFFFMKPTLLSFALLIITGMFSTLIMHLMLKKVRRVLAFTAPFIISIWLVLIILKLINVELFTSPTAIPFVANLSGDIYGLMRGIAQVMFQDHWLSGLLFICGLLFSSPKITAWVIAASALSMLSARIFGFSEELIILGIYSFNATLVVIALKVLYIRRVWPIIVAVMITVLLTQGFKLAEVPALTAPFVITSWLIIALVKPNNHFIKRL